MTRDELLWSLGILAVLFTGCSAQRPQIVSPLHPRLARAVTSAPTFPICLSNAASLEIEFVTITGNLINVPEVGRL